MKANSISDLLSNLSQEEIKQTAENVQITNKLYNFGNRDEAIQTVVQVLRMNQHEIKEENF